jgi:hypothetical protein
MIRASSSSTLGQKVKPEKPAEMKVSISAAKAQLTGLVKKAERGEEVTPTRRGKDIQWSELAAISSPYPKD